MERGGRGRSVVNLVAGALCLAAAALNWWNMIGVGVTFWRIFLASAVTLIGLFLLYKGIRSRKAQETRDSRDTGQV